MAEETNTQAGQGEQQPQAQAQQERPAAQEDQQPGPVPYDRFQEVNKRARAAEEALAKIEAERKAAEEKALADQNRWKEIAEQREKELANERLARTRQQVAMQKGLPADLVDRLQGTTSEELAADADRLLQFIKPPTGPGVPPSGRRAQPANLDLSSMDPSQIRKTWKGSSE